MRTKRALALSGLIGMLAALAFAAPAGAATVDRIKGACVTAGTAQLNATPPVIGGTGSYTFTELAFTCVGVELSKGTSIAVSLISLGIHSPGSWTNVVCGTGKAVSTPNGGVVDAAVVIAIVGTPKTVTAAQWQAIVADLDYVVEFVAYQGLLKWTDTSAQKGPDLVPKVLTAGPSGYPGGVVDIAVGGTVPCSRSFVVTGALAVDWSPGNPIL